MTYLLRIIIQFSVERTDTAPTTPFENELDVDSKKKGGQPSRPLQSIDLAIWPVSEVSLYNMAVMLLQAIGK
jgi:hypothetical protein